MFNSKYGKVLTVLLIIAVIVIVGLLCFFGYERIVKDKNEKDAIAAIEEFDRVHKPTETKPQTSETPSNDDNNTTGESGSVSELALPTTSPSGSSSGSSSGSNNTSTYKGFEMVGHIEIPRTKVRIPILNVVTKKSLETAVAIVYPLEAQLNEPGNIVIAGHNYRNQMFFSNNKKLKSGDKIYITDTSGRKMTYEVYDKFEAAPEDTSFYARDTGGVPEITLTTCTEDSSKRTIILAKAQ